MLARLMHQARLSGISRRKDFKTTVRDRDSGPARDLVQRRFTADHADQLWVADIPYFPTLAGFLFLGVVLDTWSRRIVGWATATHLRTELVLKALDMALWQRRPDTVIHYSDQGTQYTSISFGLRCKAGGVRLSMGPVGDCFDNALCERLDATRMRAARPPPLSSSGRRQAGRVRVCGRLVQPTSPALVHQLLVTCKL
jgi:putative transposase